MDTIKLPALLGGRTFKIPAFQRDYAWTTTQTGELLEDIGDAIADSAPHYIGTIVLAGDGNSWDIVDGQQRLTTITLLVAALLSRLSSNDPMRIWLESELLRQKPGGPLKITFGRNDDYVGRMLSGYSVLPDTPGRRCLSENFRFLQERVEGIYEHKGPEAVYMMLDAIKTKIELLYFQAGNSGQAIRMFQTVNDRGLPLTFMEKAKALLVFYSNRYLGGTLDTKIQERFGACFQAIDRMRVLTREEGYNVDNLNRSAFSEDDMLRYHYLSYEFDGIQAGEDWGPTNRFIFDNFLKGTLKQLAGRGDAHERLSLFIDDYTGDLAQFFQSMSDLIQNTRTNPAFYRLFVVLGMSALLYPLVVRLAQRGLLLPCVLADKRRLLDLVETCDVRVFKTRGTNPTADIGRLSHRSRTLEPDQIAERLHFLTTRWMPDDLFRSHLQNNAYENDATPYILLCFDEAERKTKYEFTEIVERTRETLSKEHIFSVEPHGEVCQYGFTGQGDYAVFLNSIGNLTLLSASLNSRCNNQPVEIKVSSENLYKSSHFFITRNLCVIASQFGGKLLRPDMEVRANKIANFAAARWAA